MNIHTLRICLVLATFGFQQPLDCGSPWIVVTAELSQPLNYGNH